MKREDKDLMDILLEVCQDEQAELKITRTHINAFFLVKDSPFFSSLFDSFNIK